jgi:hypothetical protein
MRKFDLNRLNRLADISEWRGARRAPPGGGSEVRTDSAIANIGEISSSIPITQCNRTKSPARFFRKWNKAEDTEKFSAC